MTITNLLDFAVITIFAREFLEGSIILGEYRTIIQRGGPSVLPRGVTPAQAHAAVWTAAWVAIAAALLLIAVLAILLSVLSRNFNDKTSKIIEGLSKMVAGVCLLQLSLKLPKFLGVYGSCKQHKKKQQQPPTSDQTEPAQKEDTASVATDNETRTALSYPPAAAAVSLGAEPDAESSRTSPQKQESSDTQENSSNKSGSSDHTTAAVEPTAQAKLSLPNIRFNVAWNIWREGKQRFVFFQSQISKDNYIFALFLTKLFQTHSLCYNKRTYIYSCRMRSFFNSLFLVGR